MGFKNDTNYTINEVLTRSPILSELLKKVEQLTKLNLSALKALEKIDPSLAKHCRVMNCRDGILMIATTSAVFGHTLRFLSLDLLSSLRSEPEWCGLTAIQFQVRPSIFGMEQDAT